MTNCFLQVIFLIFCIFQPIQSQIQLGQPFVDPGIIQGFLSPQTIITIANYYGCGKWNQTHCVQCSSKFYFNQRNVCVQIDPLCKQFNFNQKSCSQCYIGYTLSKQKCQKIKIQPGCLKYNNKECQQCALGYFITKDKKCQVGNPLCRQKTKQGDKCVSCYLGYQLINQKCVAISLESNSANFDSGCHKFDLITQKCLICSFRYYKNKDNKCTAVNDLCRQWNTITGDCTSCYSGYYLRTGKCQLRNMLCKTFLQNNCTSCYQGYSLIDGKCIIE